MESHLGGEAVSVTGADRRAVLQVEGHAGVPPGVDPPQHLCVVERVPRAQLVDGNIEVGGGLGIAADLAVEHVDGERAGQPHRAEPDWPDRRAGLNQDNRTFGNYPEVGPDDTSRRHRLGLGRLRRAHGGGGRRQAYDPPKQNGATSVLPSICGLS